MKSILAVVLFLFVSASASAQNVDLGVSISVGQPGFYGQIILGTAPAPALIFAQPILIIPGPALPPIYLYVPPSHAHNWRFYCHRYNACGRRVYFVQPHWYSNVYVPYYHRHRNEYREREHREFRDHQRYRYYDRSREHERRRTPRTAPHTAPHAVPQHRPGGGETRSGHDRRDRRGDRERH